jgi:hypothetical protein
MKPGSPTDAVPFRALQRAVRAGDYVLLRRLLSQEERSGRPMKELVNVQDKMVCVMGRNFDPADLCSHDAVLLATCSS